MNKTENVEKVFVNIIGNNKYKMIEIQKNNKQIQESLRLKL